MIRGKVRASNGMTLNNAIVELRQAAGAVIGQSVTRNDGDFSFSGLRPGEYELLITLTGYEPATQLVQLKDSMMSNSATAISQVMSLEITIRARPDLSPGPPGTDFAQDVPRAARAAYAKGISKTREGKSEEAVALMREAIAEYNDYFDAYLALGFEFYRLGKDAEALEALERARQINDRGPAVYYTFGMVMARQQKFRAAEYAFGKAAELNANNVSAHFNHAVALIEVALRSSDPSQVKTLLTNADRELDSAWELSGKQLNAVFLQRARVHEERGNNQAAARELENYLKAEPGAKNAAALKETIARLREKK
ncbi:MAG TPA: carboxypeptidase regulatory-like domain-containing protein [Blastocatellia bacterium]|nr:carboxypeptidase regulatory-like domain-containing protein [Blastocatellia bacterium]